MAARFNPVFDVWKAGSRYKTGKRQCWTFPSPKHEKSLRMEVRELKWFLRRKANLYVLLLNLGYRRFRRITIVPIARARTAAEDDSGTTPVIEVVMTALLK